MSQGPILPQQYPQHIIVPGQVDVDTKYSKNYTIPAAIVVLVVFALTGLGFLVTKTLMHDRERLYLSERRQDEMNHRLVIAEEKINTQHKQFLELQREFDRHKDKLTLNNGVTLVSREREKWGNKWTYRNLADELEIVLKRMITQMKMRMIEVFKVVFSYDGIGDQNHQIGGR